MITGIINTDEVSEAAQKADNLMKDVNSEFYCISDFRKLDLSSKVSVDLVKKLSKYLFKSGLKASARIWDIKVWEKIVQTQAQYQMQGSYMVKDFFDIPTAEMWVNNLKN